MRERRKGDDAYSDPGGPPPKPVASVTVYTCPRCGRRFERDEPATVRCAVVHVGGCCHYGERELR